MQEVATTINVELDNQDKMLDDLNEDMDKAEEKMSVVMEGMAKLLKTRCAVPSHPIPSHPNPSPLQGRGKTR